MRFGRLVWLMVFCFVGAQAQQKPEHMDAAIVERVDVSPVWMPDAKPLDTSDPQGEFQKSVYKPVVKTLYREWVRRMPREAYAPKCAEGTSVVLFHLLADGKVAQEALQSSTGDKKLDRHAMRAVKKARFAAFPDDLRLQEVAFRVHFEVNPPIGANKILSACN